MINVPTISPANYAELSSLLSLCGREKRYLYGSFLHAFIIKNINHFSLSSCTIPRNILVIWNSLISMYSKCGQLQDAVKVFDKMPLRDTVSWNSMISACFVAEQLLDGFEHFRRLRMSKTCWYDQATLTTVLSVCAERELLYACSMLHSLIISSGYASPVQVGNALITSYFRCGCHLSAKKVFDGMVVRNVITWTAMVSGLAQCLLLKESLICFREMQGIAEANSVTYASSLLACSEQRALREGQQIHGRIEKSGLLSDLHVESALMDMYSKCGEIGVVLRLFHCCVEPDEVLLTVTLVSLAQNGMERRAFEMFAEMVGRGIEIDENMISAVLGAFRASTLFSQVLGKQIHSFAVKKGLLNNIFVCNGLINMYSKCGQLTDSIKLFNVMPHKNSVSWNSMVAALGRHGYASEAFKHYREMMSDGIEPTDITYLSLLHACSHVGSIEMAVEVLNSMSSVHGITPRAEHYACIVDMLGRAGRLYEARSFIEGLHGVFTALLWQALLGACSIHGDLLMGRYAAEQLVTVAPDCTSAYVLLANIYSAEGRWGDRARIIVKMKEKGVKKETGVSWIELEKNVHSFVVEDDLHPQAQSIYEILGQLTARIRDEEILPYEKLMFNELEF